MVRSIFKMPGHPPPTDIARVRRVLRRLTWVWQVGITLLLAYIAWRLR